MVLSHWLRTTALEARMTNKIEYPLPLQKKNLLGEQYTGDFMYCYIELIGNPCITTQNSLVHLKHGMLRKPIF